MHYLGNCLRTVRIDMGEAWWLSTVNENLECASKTYMDTVSVLFLLLYLFISHICEAAQLQMTLDSN